MNPIPIPPRRPSPRRVVALLALVALASAAPLAGQTPRPLPGDPLSPAEREAAIRLVLREPRIRALEAGEGDVSTVSLVLEKDGDRILRRAEVLLSVLRREHVGLRARVDLESGTLVEVQAVGRALPVTAPGAVRPGGVTQPGVAAPPPVASPRLPAAPAGQGAPERVPFSPNEIELARATALRSPEVARLAGGRTDGLTTEFLPLRSVDPNDPCTHGRCIEVFFRRGDVYFTTSAVVNVLTGAVQLRGGQR